MHRNSARIVIAGQPVNWLGANFWSRTGGPLMWRNYDPDTVRKELAVLREHGLGMTRSFFYWPDFMPEPDRVDDAMTDRFADFLERHAEADMSTVPTFIVGHMSGENWDPPWRDGRDLYTDVWMVARQAWFAGEMVRRFGAHPAVCGWLVSNEMPIYSGGSAPREVIAAWAQIIRDAVRAAGGQQPFSLGDGAWGTQASSQHAGFALADAARLCDFLGPHVYPVGDDEVRQHYTAAWECELAGTFGRPVVLEEFGVSSDFVSGANAARYYRQVLHNSLLAGATGWIGWCNSDYDDLAGQDPYRHHAFELHFGLTDSHGHPKPPLTEMKAFAETLRAVDIGRCQRAPADTALVVSSYLDTRRMCLPGWQTCRSRWPGRAKASAATPCSTSCPRSSSCSRPPGTSSNDWRARARRSTSHTHRDRPAGIAAPRMAASTRCSGSSISSGPGWSTRSKTTRWPSPSSRTSPRWRPAPG
jgi:endo-1,4-beta-mannosidase